MMIEIGFEDVAWTHKRHSIWSKFSLRAMAKDSLSRGVRAVDNANMRVRCVMRKPTHSRARGDEVDGTGKSPSAARLSTLSRR